MISDDETIAVIAVALGLIVSTAAEAKVTLVRVTSLVRAGAYATLTLKVSRPARCSITVYYKSGPGA